MSAPRPTSAASLSTLCSTIYVFFFSLFLLQSRSFDPHYHHIANKHYICSIIYNYWLSSTVAERTAPPQGKATQSATLLICFSTAHTTIFNCFVVSTTISRPSQTRHDEKTPQLSPNERSFGGSLHSDSRARPHSNSQLSSSKLALGSNNLCLSML